MIKSIGNIFANLCIAIGMCLGSVMLIMSVACLFTPHKTKYGEFTDVVKYWTDNTYFCRNFDCPESLKQEVNKQY